MLTEEESRRLNFRIYLVHVQFSLIHQLKPKLLGFFQRDWEVIYFFHNVIHNLFRRSRKCPPTSDLGTPPVFLLRWHISC